MTVKLISAPAMMPVSLTKAKDHLHILGNDEDSHVRDLIVAATQHVENSIWRVLITQTLDLFLNSFYDPIEIPLGQLQSVSSINYIDVAGVSQTLAPSVYSLNANSDPGVVSLAYSQSWPQTRTQHDAVVIRFIAGYGDAGTVPAPITQAILLLIGHMYENRELTNPIALKEVPMAYRSLLYPYRLQKF